MTESISFTIDKRELEAPAGTTILQAAKEANILIPHLCDNDELKPFGSCRVCMVEITLKRKTSLVSSCNYKVREGLSVRTDTERVKTSRQFIMELLLARNPSSPVLLEMAEDLKINSSRFKAKPVGCILCGLCVRVCREVVGLSAIGFKGRGVTRKVATPFDAPSNDCIACGACSYACPVGVIPMIQKNGVRKIWGTEFKMLQCKKCGREVAPKKQLEHFQKNYNLPANHFDTCLHCR